jgi:thiol-disulfide isomerase/thioredoxin
MSLSGHERDHLFINQQGQSIADVSGLSGADSNKDGRSAALWDFDRDGWQDIVLVNVNTPVLNLYRNQLGSFSEPTLKDGNVLAVNMVGGNSLGQPSSEFSNRDGYGAKLIVRLPGQTLLREHRCGEGLAAQNSSTLLIGIGSNEGAESIEIQWPSGISQKYADVSAGQMVTLFENVSDSPTGSGIELAPYTHVQSSGPAQAKPRRPDKPLFFRGRNENADLILFTSMATWCPNCKKHIPQLLELRARFENTRLKIIGVPIDKMDSDEKLEGYVESFKAPYELDGRWTAEERANFEQAVQSHLGSVVLPASIVADKEGRILDVFAGVPTRSDIVRQQSHQDGP